MKPIVFGWSILLVFLAHAGAQGTLQFVAALTGNSDASGSGTFSLTTNRLAYMVQTPAGFDQGQITGPGADPNAPVIFTLHLSFCDPPGPGPNPGRCVFKGSPTLSDDQISQLESGQWYVQAISANPANPIQGQ